MKLYNRAAAETVHSQDVRGLSNTSTGKSAARGADASWDRVQFSGDLGRLARIFSTYYASRANRVQVLAAQHQSGNYRPDSAATSQGMVTEALVAGTQLDAGRDGDRATGGRASSNSSVPASS
jgi:hypothetical protein